MYHNLRLLYKHLMFRGIGSLGKLPVWQTAFARTSAGTIFPAIRKFDANPRQNFFDTYVISIEAVDVWTPGSLVVFTPPCQFSVHWHQY
jgi:hypothetical protein